MRYLPETAAGAALAFDVLGPSEGRPVRVFLAGLGSAATVAYVPTVADPRISGSGQQILVDLIGSGWSDPDDDFDFTIDGHARTVIALLDSLALGEVELVGHSLGGSIAISIAALRPDLVGRLTVIEPNLDPGVGTTSAQIAALSEEEFVASGYARLVAGILDRGASGDESSAEWGRTIQRWSGRALHRTAVSLLAVRPSSFREQLAAFDGERRYISGELSREELDSLRAVGCDVRVVAGAGHDVMFDNLDGFIAALL